MSIDADLPCPFSGCGEKHKTYKVWFKHMKQHHNLFQQEEAWKSIATDQLQTIGGLKYCQKCHEPWNANGLARHETSCRKNIETAQTMTSEAANQAAAAVQPGDIANIGNKEVIVDWNTITPELLQEACAICISCHTKISAFNERVITGMGCSKKCMIRVFSMGKKNQLRDSFCQPSD